MKTNAMLPQQLKRTSTVVRSTPGASIRKPATAILRSTKYRPQEILQYIALLRYSRQSTVQYWECALPAARTNSRQVQRIQYKAKPSELEQKLHRKVQDLCFHSTENNPLVPIYL